MVHSLIPAIEFCLCHTAKDLHPVIPFYWRNHPTALYYMSRERYSKYFTETSPKSVTKTYTNWHQVKQGIQQMHQHELEEQGRILKAIFIDREATEDSRAVDYLLWLDFQWSLYQKNLKRAEFKFDNFVDFVQSDLVHDTELSETWKIKNDTTLQISEDDASSLESRSSE